MYKIQNLIDSMRDDVKDTSQIKISEYLEHIDFLGGDI